MKRVIGVILILFIASSLLFADVVRYEAEGSGESLEEAKERAKMNLAEIVFPSSVSTETTTRTTDGTAKGSYSSSYEKKSNSTVIGEFPGLEYNNIRRKDGLYTVTTSIEGDARTLKYYSVMILSEKANVEELYESYLSHADASTTERRELLFYVLSYYYNYVSYKNIYIKLGGVLTQDLELKSVPAKAVLLINYHSLLDEEANELTLKTTLSSINKEIETRLGENEMAREEYNKSLENVKAQEKLQKELELQAALSVAFVSSEGNGISVEEPSSYGLESFKSYLEAIDEYDASLTEVCKAYEAIRDEWKTSIDKSFEEESAAIWARTYPLAQRGLDGSPTQNAKALREDEVSALKREKDLELEEVYKEIDDKFKDEIQKRYNLLIETIKALEEKKFTLYSKNGDFSVNMFSPNYDGENFSWYLNVEFPSPISLEISKVPLSYSSLTGNKIPGKDEALKALLSDPSYIATVETYTEYLNAGKYECSISFTVRVDEEQGSLKLTLSSLKLTFPDAKTIPLGFSSSTIKFSDNGEIPFNLLNALYIDKEIESASYYESYDFLKARTRPKEKEPLQVSLKKGAMCELTYGKAYDSRVKSAVGYSFELQFFLGKHFFLSGSMTLFLLMQTTESKDANPAVAVQVAVLPGVGVMMSDSLGVLMKIGFMKNRECILSPRALYKVKVKGTSFFISAGADINLGTKNASFALGTGALF